MLGLFKNKNQNGYAFTKERAKELKENREYLLGEYDCSNCDNSWKKTKKRTIKVIDGFSDVRELIAFYGLKPENCVAVLSHSGKYNYCLNEVPVFPKDIAGVFGIHEKNKKVSFPDGVSENTILYNVELQEKNLDYYMTPGNTLFKAMPTKERLIKIIFGSEQRAYNKTLSNYLLSLDVVKSDNLYFYFITKASASVRQKILDFKDKYFELKEKSMFLDKVFPQVPDCVIGGAFDLEKAEKDAKEGVKISKFYGHIFYELLSKEIPEFEEIVSKEYERIKFIEQFPGLEEEFSSKGAFNNEFGGLAIYAPTSIDRARYDYYDNIKLRGIEKRVHCFWDSFLRDLEKLYSEEAYSKYCGSVKEEEKRKTDKVNQIFAKISRELTSGKAAKDDDIISVVNLNSSKPVQNQLERNTTFTFLKLPVIDSKNMEVKGRMYKVAIDCFIEVADKELEKDFIKSNEYETI